MAEEKKKAKSNDPMLAYSDVAICLGLLGKDGKRQEVVHQIDSDSVRIVSVSHGVVEKMRQHKEDGQLLGFEPTGEYELTLKVKYIKE